MCSSTLAPVIDIVLARRDDRGVPRYTREE
jgi:hypothetical protein